MMRHLPRFSRVVLVGASAAALVLLVAGCGNEAATSGAAGGSTAASGKRFELSLDGDACNFVTAGTLASTFGMPAEEIEQYGSSSMCMYNWKGDERTLDVTIHLTSVADTAAEAARTFNNATRGISGAELDRAMAAVADQARKSGDLDEAGAAAADALVGETGKAMADGSGGLQFRDVDGLGDQARVLVDNGDVHVLHGNLYFNIGAYSGPQMPPPSEYTAEAVMKASKAWQASIVPEREEAGIALAHAVIATLE